MHVSHSRLTRYVPLFFLLLALGGCSRSGGPVAQKAPVSAPESTSPHLLTSGELLSSGDVSLMEQLNREYTHLAKAVLPGVVSISCSDTDVTPFGNFNQDFPFQFHFGPDFKAQPDQADSSTSLGSGVILTPDGYIVTNYHVITTTHRIEVGLFDHRLFPAQLVASDEQADVAVLKINADHLMALPWGDSDALQVGEQVFAVGNPFDLNDTVSNGIVSAKDRNLPNTNNYEDYIQTNAAINPGNSGGALVNIYGQVVGINAAIASTSRVNMGIAFAIPSNLARFAIESLLKNGKVIRGYLGVRYKDMAMTEELCHQLNLPTDQGALVDGVEPLSPADKAGLKAEDFIIAIHGRQISEPADLRLLVSLLPIGQNVEIQLIRNGQPVTVTATITAQPDQVSATQPSTPPLSQVGNPPYSGNALTGVRVAELTEATRQQFDLENDLKNGLVVIAVEESSLAAVKDLEPGDVIESARNNGGAEVPLTTEKDFSALVKKLKPEDKLVLLVHRGKATSLMDMSVPK